MKIRTDFVTNSSSSSFTLLLKDYDKAGNEYKYTSLLPPQLQMFDWLPESTRAKYTGSLEAVAKCKDTRTLAETLVKGVDEGLMDDVCNILMDNGLRYDEDSGKILPDEDLDEDLDEDFDDDEADEGIATEAGMVIQAINEAKDNFVKAVSNNIAHPEDIAKNVVEREYYAWGEYAEMLAYNDGELRRLLEAYAKAAPEKKEESK